MRENPVSAIVAILIYPYERKEGTEQSAVAEQVAVDNAGAI